MKRTLTFAIVAAAACALAGAVAELAAPHWPMTAARDIRAGEPVGVASGKAEPLPVAGGAIGVATESGTTNGTVTVKAGWFLLPAATNLNASGIGSDCYWSAAGEVVNAGSTTNKLGKLLFIENGRACVKIEP